jgi:hypothetical protein
MGPERADKLVRKVSNARDRAALRRMLRTMFTQKEVRGGEASLLRDFESFLRTLELYSFRYTETSGYELHFNHLGLATLAVTLVPQQDGAVDWSHSAPSGTTYGRGLRSLKKMLITSYGKINTKGITYRGRRRVILAGPSALG